MINTNNSFFFRMANSQYQDEQMDCSFNDLICFSLCFTLPVCLLGLTFFVAVDPSLSSSSAFMLFYFIFSMTFLLTCVLSALKISENSKLSSNKINSLYEKVKTNNHILSKLQNLHHEQGYVLEKQRHDILNDLREEKIAFESLKN